MKKSLFLLIQFLFIMVSFSEPVLVVHDSLTAKDENFITSSGEKFVDDLLPDIIYTSAGVNSFLTYDYLQEGNLPQYQQRDINYDIQPGSHPFVSALYFAFARHQKITITPDMIWLLVCQGISTHVNENSKEYRHLFTKEFRKSEIKVEVPELLADTSRWDLAAERLTDSLQLRVDSALFSLFDKEFSTTTLIEKTAMQMTLLNASQEYYDFTVATLCGIPEIRLEGTLEDWQWISMQVKGLNRLDLGWWVDHLSPVLLQFEKAFKGDVDKKFWCSIFKDKGVSGEPLKVNGWILNLFPYVQNRKGRYIKNEYLGNVEVAPVGGFPPLSDEERNQKLMMEFSAGYSKGYRIGAFGTGMQETPFTWKLMNKKHRMKFYSGFLGIEYDSKEYMLIPNIGYVVGKR